jgi:hypothetical protein
MAGQFDDLIPSRAAPGALGVVPPNPAIVAAKLAEQQRQAASDARSERSDQRAAAAAEREAAQWNASHNPDGSPKVQAPSLLGDPNLTGPEYLASLPQNIRNRVKQLLDGRSILTAREKGQPLGQQLMDAANQADPTFDENVSHARYVERTQYTGMGKGSQLVQAANRFGRHLGDLYEASRALGGPDLGWSPLSNLATATTNSFRQSKVATYNAILPLIQGEVQKLTKNGSATEGEAQHIMANLSVNQPEDVRYAAMKELARLGRAQVEPLHQSWESAWQGSTPPPIPNDIDPVANAIFDAVDQGSAPPKRNRKGEFFVAGGANDSDGAGPPTVGQSGGGKGPPGGLGGPRADYSSMVGGPGKEVTALDPSKGVLGQTYRTAYDPVGAAALSSFIRKGAPYETAAAYATSHGFNPPPEADYAAAVAFQKNNPNATPNVEADKTIPTTFGERMAASPAAALVSGAGSASTAGLSDVLGRSLVGPEWDANRQALAAAQPGADLAGNVAGGALGMVGASKLAPGALALGAKAFGRFAPAVGDAAYGATYGASENPDDPLMGGFTGAIMGAGAGYGGRKVAGGLANAISPPAGNFGPAYAQGVFPTVGQRFAKSGLAGRMVNTAEQAMQSFPGLGSLVTRARDIPRDAAQLGAFNEGLKELAPFDPVLGRTVSKLPDEMAPGTEPHAFTSKAFGDAYDTARSGMQFVPDHPYIADHAAFNDRLNNGVLSAPQAAQVQQVINNSVGSRLPRGGGAMTGDAYKAAGTEMDKAITAWGKAGDTQPMAEALSDYMTIFDNAARRNSDPQAVSLLDAADRGYAKYARVRNAAARVGGDAGTFTMKSLNRAVQQEAGGVKSGPFLRGDALMQDYADAIQPLGDTLANSGTGERLLTNRMLLGAQGGVGAAGVGIHAPAALMAHPGALAPFALYAPGINKLATRAIAPREFTLPPILSQPLDTGSAWLRQRAPIAGRLAVPGALAWESAQ